MKSKGLGRMLDVGRPKDWLAHTPSVIVASTEIQVHILPVIYATIVPPRDPICVRQPATPLRFVKKEAVAEERRPVGVWG